MADLPDVYLLLLFRKLSAEDRVRASQVCINWYYRVREVNKAVHSLTITVDCNQAIENESFGNQIDRFTYGYNPCMKQQLMEDTDQEKLECFAKENTLHLKTIPIGLQLNSNTVQQIIKAFPAIIELNFIPQSNKNEYEYLVQMLKTSWGQQLTALRVIELCAVFVNDQTNQRLSDSINRLTALKHLAILKYAKDGLKLPHPLPIFARLKEVRFRQFDDNDLFAFLRSVHQYAADNEDLRIDLPLGLNAFVPYLRSHNFKRLIEPYAARRVVRLSDSMLPCCVHNLWSICTFFPNLTSLSVQCEYTANCQPIFTAISQSLSHLRFLKLGINFLSTNRPPNEEDDGQVVIARPPLPPPPTTVLPSVKALELHVIFTSHDNIQWLNLNKTMPNLQAIHFETYSCQKCKVFGFHYDIDDVTALPELTAAYQKCFEAVLPRLSQITAVPLEKITIRVKDLFTASAKQLLLQ